VLLSPLLLSQELDVIERLKAFLTSKCHTAWEQMNTLREVQFELQLDISNKKDAVAIDKENFKMNKDCAGTSYKPEPLRIPKKFVLSFDERSFLCFDQRTLILVKPFFYILKVDKIGTGINISHPGFLVRFQCRIRITE
jgi:hypothetical protein